MLKSWSVGGHPVVLDTDGYVRWVGTAGNAQQGSTFVGNNFFVGDGSKLQRIGLDGNVTRSTIWCSRILKLPPSNRPRPRRFAILN
jgi:hypothetical protein